MHLVLKCVERTLWCINSPIARPTKMPTTRKRKTQVMTTHLNQLGLEGAVKIPEGDHDSPPPSFLMSMLESQHQPHSSHSTGLQIPTPDKQKDPGPVHPEL